MPTLSSTEVRRRLAAGEPVDGLLPNAVAGYIREHRLYLP
jgi:nicotinate-nucleotide adenylyltransferase